MKYNQKGIKINGKVYKTTTHVLRDNGSGIRISLAKSVYKANQTIEIMHEDDFMELKKQVEYYSHQNHEKQTQKLNEQITTNENKIAELQQELQQTIEEKDATIDELKAELREYKNKCNQFKETIADCESDIHEKDNIIKELTPYKDYIAPKQHYDELTALKDNFTHEKQELLQQIADKQMRIVNQEKEFEVQFADEVSTLKEQHSGEISSLKEQHTNEKSALLLAYNQNINHYKNKYNSLAEKYNQLYGDVSKLSRLNTMFNGRHNELKEEHAVVELEVVKKDNTQNTTINLNEGLQN